MSNKTIAQLDAKTPLNTDLVPVADPVTGIAGKSTISQILFKDKVDPLSIFPSPPSEYDLQSILGNTTYQSTASIPYRISYTRSVESSENSGYSTSINIYGSGTSFNSSGFYDSLVTQIYSEIKYLDLYLQTNIASFQNVSSVSFPNLVTANITFAYLINLTSINMPNLEVGFFNFNNGSLGSYSGTLSFPKIKHGSFYCANAPIKMTGIDLPLMTDCQVLNFTASSTATGTNFTTINAPLLKRCGYLGVNNLSNFTTISLPELESFGFQQSNNFNASYIQTINLPKLKYSNSVVPGATYSALTTLNLPMLKTAMAGTFITFSVLTSLNLPELVSLGMPYKQFSGVGFAYSYAIAGGGFGVNSGPLLTTVNLPKLEFVSNSTSDSIKFTSCPVLSSFTMNPTPKYISQNFTVTGAALNQASVDGILVALAYMDGTANAPWPAYSSKTINLSGGTSATPSATGLAAKATLVARGCTVTHN